MPRESALRWLVVGVVVLSSALNYLDRMVLAALAPTIQSQFQITAREYGFLLSAFSIVYAVSSPVAGLLVDRAGLAAGAAMVVGLWSLAGTATGLVTSFGALVVCRAALGFAESGGIPATGKAFATYLEPKDRAMGTALNQVGLTIGASTAPLLTAWCLQYFDWRAAFVIAGLAGFTWIPLWLAASRVAPAATVPAAPAEQASAGELIRDVRLLSLVAASMLSMTVYSLWTNWTTLFLVNRHALSPSQANRGYAWIPPVAATLGGLAGGWLAQRLIRNGVEVGKARLRISIVGGLIVPLMAYAPLAPTPGLATAAICAGFFGVTCQSVNYYAVPLDTFGVRRAAFAISALTGSFGLMQALLSPLIGDWSERFGWGPVCYIVALMPLVSVLLLRRSLRGSE
jgi:MFS transporter, ACS family, hexuronate transporter